MQQRQLAGGPEPLPQALSSPCPPCQHVTPGDAVLQLPKTGVVRIGSGLAQDGASLVATRPGVLQQARDSKLWVESQQKR